MTRTGGSAHHRIAGHRPRSRRDEPPRGRPDPRRAALSFIALWERIAGGPGKFPGRGGTGDGPARSIPGHMKVVAARPHDPDRSGRAAAEACFHRALAVARRQGRTVRLLAAAFEEPELR